MEKCQRRILHGEILHRFSLPHPFPKTFQRRHRRPRHHLPGETGEMTSPRPLAAASIAERRIPADLNKLSEASRRSSKTINLDRDRSNALKKTVEAKKR